MTRLLFLMTMFAAASGLNAQDLHVHYDAFTDSVYYLRGEKTIHQPLIKKGENIWLHVNNYNNYLYNIEVVSEVGRESVSSGSGFNPGQLLSGGGFDPIQMLLGAGGSAGGPGIPGISGRDVSKGDGMGSTSADVERQKRLDVMRQTETKVNTTFTLLADLDDQISEKNEAIQTALEAQQIQTFVASELRKLRYNPQLAPHQIRALSHEYMARIFNESDPTKLDITAVLQKTDAIGQLAGLQQEYETYTALYAGQVDSLKDWLDIIQGFKSDFSDSNIDRFYTVADKKLATPEKNLKTYQRNITVLQTQLPQVKNLDFETLVQLRTDYLILEENDFSRQYRHTAEGDNLTLQLVLTPIDSAQTPGVATKYVPAIRVDVYGGFKVAAGLGLSFGQFFQRPMDYFVRDSLIRSSAKDAFTPYLSSFIHFYRQGRGAVSAGGSFGVGIPLGDGGGLEALSFFLGPCLVFGRGERIVLSAGIMGGKVQHLSDGYSPGDYFEADASLLKTESRYQLGYFAGLSFSLAGGK
ncbi:MAG: hypothetical protein IPM98_13265 [Lewinellaceae bacterium]|nr:hypothetical protein [Lewinellaceae bacterium]